MACFWVVFDCLFDCLPEGTRATHRAPRSRVPPRGKLLKGGLCDIRRRERVEGKRGFLLLACDSGALAATLDGSRKKSLELVGHPAAGAASSLCRSKNWPTSWAFPGFFEGGGFAIPSVKRACKCDQYSAAEAQGIKAAKAHALSAVGKPGHCNLGARKNTARNKRRSWFQLKRSVKNTQPSAPCETK